MSATSVLDLELVDTVVLLDALDTRFSACVFGGFKDMSEQRSQVTLMWRGDPMRCGELSDCLGSMIPCNAYDDDDEDDDGES